MLFSSGSEKLWLRDGCHSAGAKSGALAFDHRLHRLLCGLDDLLDHRHSIKQDLGLNETQFGLLVGTPILTGSLIRLVLGIWTDQYGGRLVYTVGDAGRGGSDLPADLGQHYPQFLLAALGVGIAGGSFAVGIAYVSRWYPPASRARRSASSAPAMSARRSPSSSRRSCWSPTAGRPSRRSGRSASRLMAHRLLVHHRGRSRAVARGARAARSRPAPGSSSSRSRTSRSGVSRSIISSCSAPSSRCRCGCRDT